MNKSELTKVVLGARCPEDVFGLLEGDKAKALSTVFRAMAKVLHPDVNHSDPDSDRVFGVLESLREKALKRIKDGSYGSSILTTINVKSEVYTVFNKSYNGDMSRVYHCEDRSATPLVAKVVRSTKNNDLIKNEATILRYLRDESPSASLEVMKHVPELVDSFDLKQGPTTKRVNVMKRLDNYVTLQDVIEAYPQGLDPRDAAWMFNRLLGAFVAAHQSGIVHGAVVPEHVMVWPEEHNGVLVDWCYATKDGKRTKAVVPTRMEFYPLEVLLNKAGTPASDIYMAACCLLALLGGNVRLQTIPDRVPRGLRGFVRHCLLPAKHRPKDAWDLHQEFAALLHDLYGPRTFRKFAMPLIA